MRLPTPDLDILLIVRYYKACKYIKNVLEKQTSHKKEGWISLINKYVFKC